MGLMGKKKWSMKSMLPGKKTLAGLSTALAIGGTAAAAYSSVGKSGAPDYSAGLNGMTGNLHGRMSQCDQLMCSKGIRDRRGFHNWSRYGGHPDKGGDTNTFQQVNNCQMAKNFCGM
jgi:hypothetical protein